MGIRIIYDTLEASRKKGIHLIGCLLLHGYTGGPFEVDPLKEFLEEETNWKIVVPVLEGHGEQLHLDGATYETWLKDAEDALEQLRGQCAEVYVIGFSMGGMIAAYLAATQKVDKLVVLAAARRFISVKYLSHYFGEVITDKITGHLDENEWYANYKEKMGEIPFKANLEFIRLVQFTKKFLKDIVAPTFIVQGMKDEMVPYKTAYTLEEEIGSEYKQVVLFEKSDHLICLGDDGPVVNHLILEFLKTEIKENEREKEKRVH